MRNLIRILNRLNENQRGFSLIEVLIATVVMAVGLLAMAQMQVISIRFNADNRSHTDATTLAMGQLEYLKSMPFTSPNVMTNVNDYWLTDVIDNGVVQDSDNDPADLTNITGNPDHIHPDHPVDAFGYPTNSQQERFGMFWHVEDDEPNADMKTVVVTVSWYNGPERVKKHVAFSTVIAGQG